MTITSAALRVKSKARTYEDSLTSMDDWSQIFVRVCDDRILSANAKLAFWVLVSNSSTPDDNPCEYGTWASLSGMAKRAGLSFEYLDDGCRELWANHLIWMDLLPNGNAAIIKLLPLEDRYPPKAALKTTPRTYEESVKARGRFVRLSNAVLRDHELSRSAKLVFMQLVRRSNGYKLHYSNGDLAYGTWVGENTIADALKMSTDTVKRGMSELLRRGIILRQNRGQDATSITFIPDIQRLYTAKKAPAVQSI